MVHFHCTTKLQPFTRCSWALHGEFSKMYSFPPSSSNAVSAKITKSSHHFGLKIAFEDRHFLLLAAKSKRCGLFFVFWGINSTMDTKNDTTTNVCEIENKQIKTLWSEAFYGFKRKWKRNFHTKFCFSQFQLIPDHRITVTFFHHIYPTCSTYSTP